MALPVYYIQTIKLEFDRQTAGCIWAIQKICFTSKQLSMLSMRALTIVDKNACSAHPTVNLCLDPTKSWTSIAKLQLLIPKSNDLTDSPTKCALRCWLI